MIRSYTWNGRDVTEVEFAQRVSDLMRAGWTFQDPAAARDALLAKFEALAEESCHHCGRLPDTDGDHTCLCPKADGVCFDHLAYPVVSLNALRDVITEARP